jgi:hypothetical protein
MFNLNKIIESFCPCLEWKNNPKSLKLDIDNSFNISTITKNDINESDKYNIHNINFKNLNYQKVILPKSENYNKYSTTNNNKKIYQNNFKNFQIINGIIQDVSEDIENNINKTKTYKKNNPNYMDINKPIKSKVNEITESIVYKDFQNELDEIIKGILIKKPCSESDDSEYE